MTENGNNHENDVVEKNVDYLFTTTTIKLSVELQRLFEILRKRGTTGDLCFHLNKGGIRRIELSERTAIDDEEDADKIRDILGME